MRIRLAAMIETLLSAALGVVLISHVALAEDVQQGGVGQPVQQVQ